MTDKTRVRHQNRVRHLADTALALTLAAATLSACGTGPRAQTANQYSVVDGAAVSIGEIALRNAGIAPPITSAGYAQGGQAPVVVEIVNNGQDADKLISVTSSGAEAARISPTTPLDATAAASGPTSTSESSAKSESAGASASSSTQVSSNDPIPVPGNTRVQVAKTGRGATIVLTGLSSTLRPGQTIPVTFTFAKAGAVTVNLPVKLIAGQTGGPTVDVSPTDD